MDHAQSPLSKGLCGWILPGFCFAFARICWQLARSRWGSKLAQAPSPSPFALAASGFAFAAYYFYLPVGLTWMSTGFVNSATHLWGDAPFEDGMIKGCESKNNAFLMLPMLGENWHNNHHAVPASLSTWVAWYQVDFVYLTGRLLELFGLASDIRVEVPRQLRAERDGEPPTGLPVAMWALSASVWAIIVSTSLHLRSLSGKRQRVGLDVAQKGAAAL